MEKFKITDTVLVDGTIDGVIISKQVGTVIDISSTSSESLILFNNRFNNELHNSGKKDVPMQCWWIPTGKVHWSSGHHTVIKLELEF